MLDFFSFFWEKLRLNKPWKYKVPLIFSFLYFMILVSPIDGKTSVISFLVFIFTTIGFLGFGYLTNDLSDQEKDLLAGKLNSTSNLSRLQVISLFILFSIFAFCPWIYLPTDSTSLILILSELVLFFVYAFPPFRLKERGFLGILCDAMYAHVVPGILASWTFYLIGQKDFDNFGYFIILLVVWQFFSGIRNITSHQFADFENDIASNTQTFATKIGKEKTYSILKNVFLPLEVLSFIGFLIFVYFEVDLLIPGIILFIPGAISKFKKSQLASNETKVKQFTNEFLDRFYIHWFPYVILLTLLLGSHFYWWIIILHILTFFPLRNKFSQIRSKIRSSNDSKQDERIAHTAILSTNQNKFSETFIHSHFKNLNNVVIYSSGYLPKTISTDRGASFEKIPFSSNSIEENLLKSWRKHNVKVILAEYGPAGVEVMHLCRKANIPLIVHFHGFDAYRNDVLNHYGEKYKELFEIATNIIVVSHDMYDQVQKLGCHEDKIRLLPYGVDTELFSSRKEFSEPNRFIACGRFVHKKAPMKTIEAFAKVNKLYPQTELVFIGDGELLDECIALTESLGLQNNIKFLGILTPEQVSEEMNKSSLFVQHSMRTDDNDSEGTPLSVLEAASSELAVVSTKHAGIKEVIENGKSGYLVEEGDVQEMANRMIEVYSDENLRNKFGVNAREKILIDYNKKNYIEALQEVINTNLSRELSKQTFQKD